MNPYYKLPLRLLKNGAVLDADGKIAFRIVYAEGAAAKFIVDAVTRAVLREEYQKAEQNEPA